MRKIGFCFSGIMVILFSCALVFAQEAQDQTQTELQLPQPGQSVQDDGDYYRVERTPLDAYIQGGYYEVENNGDGYFVGGDFRYHPFKVILHDIGFYYGFFLKPEYVNGETATSSSYDEKKIYLGPEARKYSRNWDIYSRLGLGYLDAESESANGFYESSREDLGVFGEMLWAGYWLRVKGKSYLPETNARAAFFASFWNDQDQTWKGKPISGELKGKDRVDLSVTQYLVDLYPFKSDKLRLSPGVKAGYGWEEEKESDYFSWGAVLRFTSGGYDIGEAYYENKNRLDEEAQDVWVAGASINLFGVYELGKAKGQK